MQELNLGDDSNILFDETKRTQTGQSMQIEREVENVGSSPQNDIRRVSVPPHRMTPLKNNWEKITSLIVDKMQLLIRMNLPKRCVEIKLSPQTTDSLHLQRANDFLKAFMLGFDLNDAIALLRVDDLYIESFEIKDVRTLHGEHLSRAIGRITGEKGKTKNAIENSTRSRIVVADSKIHILGSFSNIKLARDVICRLIMGSPANKIYNQLRSISKRK